MTQRISEEKCRKNALDAYKLAKTTDKITQDNGFNKQGLPILVFFFPSVKSNLMHSGLALLAETIEKRTQIK